MRVIKKTHTVSVISITTDAGVVELTEAEARSLHSSLHTLLFGGTRECESLSYQEFCEIAPDEVWDQVHHRLVTYNKLINARKVRV